MVDDEIENEFNDLVSGFHKLMGKLQTSGNEILTFMVRNDIQKDNQYQYWRVAQLIQYIEFMNYNDVQYYRALHGPPRTKLRYSELGGKYMQHGGLSDVPDTIGDLAKKLDEKAHPPSEDKI